MVSFVYSCFEFLSYLQPPLGVFFVRDVKPLGLGIKVNLVPSFFRSCIESLKKMKLRFFKGVETQVFVH